MDKKTTTALVIGALLLLPTGATANNDGHYPATFCTPWYHNPGIAHYGENGRLANEHTSSSMTVTCPIQTRASYTYDSVSVQFRDDHSLGVNVSCAVYRHYYSSNSRTMYNINMPNINDSRFFSASVSGVSMGYSSTSAPISNYLVCEVPPVDWGQTSAIGSYTVY